MIGIGDFRPHIETIDGIRMKFIWNITSDRYEDYVRAVKEHNENVGSTVLKIAHDASKLSDYPHGLWCTMGCGDLSDFWESVERDKN